MNGQPTARPGRLILAHPDEFLPGGALAQLESLIGHYAGLTNLDEIRGFDPTSAIEHVLVTTSFAGPFFEQCEAAHSPALSPIPFLRWWYPRACIVAIKEAPYSGSTLASFAAEMTATGFDSVAFLPPPESDISEFPDAARAMIEGYRQREAAKFVARISEGRGAVVRRQDAERAALSTGPWEATASSGATEFFVHLLRTGISAHSPEAWGVKTSVEAALGELDGVWSREIRTGAAATFMPKISAHIDKIPEFLIVGQVSGTKIQEIVRTRPGGEKVSVVSVKTGAPDGLNTKGRLEDAITLAMLRSRAAPARTTIL